MRGFFTLLVFSGLLFPGIAFAAEVLSLYGDQDSYDISNYTDVFEDVQNQLTIHDVSVPTFEDQFKPMPDSFKIPQTIQPGVTSSTWWFRTRVQAGDQVVFFKNWILTAASSMFIGQIDCYIAKDETRVSRANRWYTQTVQTRGRKIDREERFFNIPLGTGHPTTIYLRIESSHYVVLRNTISTPEHKIITLTENALEDGFFFSLVIVIGIFNLFVFLWLKDRASLWQLLFVFFTGMFLLVVSNSAFSFRTTRLLGPMSFLYLQAIAINGIIISCTLFTRSFLGTHKHTPRLHKLLTGYIGLTFLSTVAMSLVELDHDCWFPIAQRILTFSPLLIPLATIFPGVVRLRQGFAPAKLYLVAWGIFAICTFLFALPIDLPGDWMIFKIGCCENIALLAFANVRRHRALVLEKKVLSKAKTIAEVAFDESEERFRQLANSTTAQIAIVQDNKLVYANETYIENAGMTWKELQQASLNDIFSPDTLAISQKAYASAKKLNKKRFRYEILDRNRRCCEVNARVVQIDGDEALISTSFDITERKMAEEQMFRAQKMASLGQIIAGVAHEINNPNNFIYFNLPILHKYIDSIKPVLDNVAEQDENLRILNMPYDMFIEDIYKLLDNMQHGSKRITDIVADLKNYVRSNEEEDKIPTAMDEVVKQVMTLVGKQVRKQVKTFDVHVQEDLPLVNMNAGKIEQVLINLVINAGQAAHKEDSWVKLVAQSVSTDTVEIKVEDNGSGIEEENLHNIFEPFFTTKGDESGTGLGLAISYKTIEDHGGTINVTSEVGEGTIFTIRLPMN